MKIGDQVKRSDLPNSTIIWAITWFDSNRNEFLLESYSHNGLMSTWVDLHTLNTSYVKLAPANVRMGYPWDLTGLVFGSRQEKLKSDECFHEFKEYVGFSEVYKYCILCDLKKGIDE